MSDEAGIPEPVKPSSPKPVKRRPSKAKKVRAPRPVKVKPPKPVKVPVVKLPKPEKPVPFERVILARFEVYLLANETPAQYAAAICRAISQIYRERALYEVLAACDPVAFVAEQYPDGDWSQTRSRVSTIRRFQQFWRSTERAQMAEGVPA